MTHFTPTLNKNAIQLSFAKTEKTMSKRNAFNRKRRPCYKHTVAFALDLRIQLPFYGIAYGIAGHAKFEWPKSSQRAFCRVRDLGSD